MWSFGVVLYQLLTGRHLFTDTDPQVLVKRQGQVGERLTALDIPPALRELLNGCLQCNQRQRFTALQALKSPLFNKWSIVRGTWHCLQPIQKAEHWYLQRLTVDPITQAMVVRLVGLCSNLKESTIIACAAISIMLLRNTWPIVPGYTPGDLRQAVQIVCQELRCAFY